MKIDICIPAFNEETIIGESIRSIREALEGSPHEYSIIVANNGSTDATAQRAAGEAGTRVLSIATRGKGAAVVAAARESRADFFCFIDADLSADPADIPTFISFLIEDQYDIVVGSRLTDMTTVKRGWMRTASSQLFNVFRRMALGIHVKDTQCGLKIMNAHGREVLARCREIGWFFDMEFLMRAERLGLRVLEKPVHWDEHRFVDRKSKLSMLRDGLAVFPALFRILRRSRKEAAASIGPGRQSFFRSEKGTLRVVLALVFLAHVASAVHFSQLAAGNPMAQPYPIGNGDSVHYVGLADGLRLHGTYVDAQTFDTARIWPWGYPSVLALSKSVTDSYVPVIGLQILLALIAVALVYRMARAFVPHAYALAAAFFFGLEPMTLVMNTLIYADGLFSSLLAITVYLAFFQTRLRSLPLWAIIGLLLATLALIKPVALYLIPLAPIAYLFHTWRSTRWQEKCGAIAVFVCCAALLVVPWMMRFERVYGVFTVSQSGPYNVFENFARPFIVWRELGASDEPMPALLVPRRIDHPHFKIVENRLQTRVSELAVDGDPWKHYGTVAKEVIFEDPLRYAYFHAINMIPFFLGSSVNTYQSYESQIGNNTNFFAPALPALFAAVKSIVRSPLQSLPVVLAVLPLVIEIFFWLLVTGLSLFAVARLRTFHALLFAALIGYFAVLTGPMAVARYRLPIEPFLFILGFAGLYAVVTWLRSRPRHQR